MNSNHYSLHLFFRSWYRNEISDNPSLSLSMYILFWCPKGLRAFFSLKAYHAACTLPSLSVSTRHVPIMLCGSCSQIHPHRYWFSSQLSFFPSVHPFIYLAKPLPLGVRREPARSLCERTQWIRHERRSPHNLDLFSFICYLSGSAAPRLSIILLCVGCMRRYACVYLCCLSIRPCKHSIFHRPPDPFFCVNNNTPANHGQTERRMLEKDYIQPVTRRTPNPACRQSEAGKGRESVRERECYPHFLPSSPPSTSLPHRGWWNHNPTYLVPSSGLCFASGCTSYMPWEKGEAARQLQRKAVHVSTLPAGYNPQYMVKD